MESDAQIPRGGKNNKDIIESDDPIENFKKDDEPRKRWERRFNGLGTVLLDVTFDVAVIPKHGV